MVTDLQVATSLAGLNGAEAVRFRAYQTDRLGTVLNDLSPALQYGGQIDLDNDRAVARTLSCTFDAKQLPSSFLTASPLQFNVSVHYQASIAGSWQDYPLGIFWLDHPQETYTPETRLWTVQGADLSYVLSLATSAATYVVPATAAYLPQVAAIIAQFGLQCGFGPDPIAPTRLTPVDFPWQPDTPWLTICNDLLAGINYYPLWVDPLGVVQTRPRGTPAFETPNVSYVTTPEPAMIQQPFHQMRGDLSKALNHLKAIIDDPTRNTAYVDLTNNDPASPISVTNLGYAKSAELRATNGTKCVYDVPTLQAICDMELQLANCHALPATLSTFPDPRRGNVEYYQLSLTDALGAIVTNQLYRVVGWTLPLTPGATMTHKLERADHVLLTE